MPGTTKVAESWHIPRPGCLGPGIYLGQGALALAYTWARVQRDDRRSRIYEQTQGLLTKTGTIRKLGPCEGAYLAVRAWRRSETCAATRV